VRGYGHPRPLPRRQAPCAGLLGRRTGAGEELTLRWPQEEHAMSAVVTPPSQPTAPSSAGWQPYRWTIEGYRKLDATGLFNDVKTMLIDGEIFTMVMPNPPHDTTLGLAYEFLRAVCPAGHYVRNQ